MMRLLSLSFCYQALLLLVVRGGTGITHGGVFGDAFVCASSSASIRKKNTRLDNTGGAIILTSSSQFAPPRRTASLNQRMRQPLSQQMHAISSLQLLMSTRGGSSEGGETGGQVDVPSATTPSSSFLTKIKPKDIITTISVLIVLGIGYYYRSTISTFFNKEQMQTRTLKLLEDLNNLPKYQSYTTYILGFTIWEIFGLSTIPVETAAGMVFGWNGLFLSGAGKLLGAVSAFCIGRYGILAKFVQRQLSKNEFLRLVEKSTDENPLSVLIYLKASCFPETIKNFGAAILFPIKLWMFTIGTMIHGWTFTSLWTFLGVDSAKRLAIPNLPPNNLLQFLILLSIINGAVISPIAMALWMKSLQDTNKHIHEEDGTPDGGLEEMIHPTNPVAE